MSRKSAKSKPTARNERRGTPPRQFRLSDYTVGQLDRIAAYLQDSGEDRKKRSRADAIRYAADRVSGEIPKDFSDKTA